MSRAAGRINAGRVQGGSRGNRTAARKDTETRDFGFLLGGWSSARRASQLRWADRRIPAAQRPVVLEYLAGEGSERAAGLAAELAERWGMEVPAARKFPVRFAEGDCRSGDST